MEVKPDGGLLLGPLQVILLKRCNCQRVFPRLSLILLFSIMSILTTAKPASIPPINDDKSAILSLQETVRGRIVKSEERSLRFTLSSGQFSCIEVGTTGANVSITLLAPGGEKLISRRSRSDRPIQISLIAAVPGVYRLNLWWLEPESISAEYTVRLSEVRAVKAGDRLRTVSERLVAEGEELESIATTSALNSAIRKYEQAALSWRSVGDALEESYVLKAIGAIYQLLGRPTKALEYLNRVLSRSNDARHRQLECETLAEIGSVLRHLGENELARQRCVEALNLSRELRHRCGEAKALKGIGDVLYSQGERQKALDYYRQALKTFSELRDSRGQAQVLLAIGDSSGELNEEETAMTAYTQALDLWRSCGDRRGQAVALSALGYIASRSGRKQDALDAYNEATLLLRAVGDPIAEAGIMNGIAYVYEELGEKDIALDYLNKAEKIYRASNYKRGQTAFLISAAQIYVAKQDFRKALSLLQQALPSLAGLNDQALETYAYKTAAAVYNALDEKARALSYYEKTLELSGKLGDPRAESYALSGLAEIWEARGEHEKALSFLNQALNLNKLTRDRVTEVSTLFTIARIHRDVGHLNEARQVVEDATAKIESLRGTVLNTDLRSSFIAAVRQNYELQIDVLMRLGKLDRNDYQATALHVSERSRARSLVEMLAAARADIRKGIDPVLLDQERKLQQSLDAKMASFSKLLAGRRNEEQLNAAGKLVDESTKELQQLQDRIRSSSPRYAALAQPQLLTLKEIQQEILDSNTLLLEYALGDDASYLWAVTSSTFAAYELPKRSEIEATARRVYDLITAQNQNIPGETPLQKQKRVARANSDYSIEAAGLSQMLLGPVASQLESRRLVIVADGALQYIPFGALPTPPDHREVAPASREASRQQQLIPLIVRHELVNIPSVSTLAVMRRELANRVPAPKTAAVLADPVFSALDPRVALGTRISNSRSAPTSRTREFDRAIREVRVSRNRNGVARLPFSREEANAIRSVAPPGEVLLAVDFDASRAVATGDDLRQYRMVHFATHGLLNSEHPELSGLIFSLIDPRGRPQNGFLRLQDIYEMNLPAELVVLSACQTALGKDVKGEGLVGLTRGFMYAGAARVVASLWQVDDSATAELMQRFYTKMLRDGLRPTTALRDAQVEMWKQDVWKLPYYWAGFTLQGEWK